MKYAQTTTNSDKAAANSRAVEFANDILAEQWPAGTGPQIDGDPRVFDGGWSHQGNTNYSQAVNWVISRTLRSLFPFVTPPAN